MPELLPEFSSSAYLTDTQLSRLKRLPLMGEVAGTYGNGRRMVQTFCASVLRVPISLGAIQKVLDRVTQAIDPYYAVIARQARQASVNSIDETSWYCLNTLQWLWVMASERVAFYMIHPR